MVVQSLYIEVVGPPPNQGVYVRGTCLSSEEAYYLRQEFRKAIMRGSDTLWVDCQQLTDISYAGQQAIFHVEQQAQAAHLVIYWCGLLPELQQRLAATGLALLLRSLPATSYQGPRLSVPAFLPLTSEQHSGGVSEGNTNVIR